MSPCEGDAATGGSDGRSHDPARCDAITRRLAHELIEAGKQRASTSEREAARVASLERALAEQRVEAAEAHARLAAAYASETWKAGATLLWLPKKARQALRAVTRAG